MSKMPLLQESFDVILIPTLYNDMPRKSIDNDGVLPQDQRRDYLIPKLLDIALDLPYSGLMEITAAFGEVIDRQLL